MVGRTSAVGLAERAGAVMPEADVPVGLDRARHHELAGRGRHVWWRRGWQGNATNLGRHPQDVELYDGGARLMAVPRTVTVFP
jgi:hypothetical protein